MGGRRDEGGREGGKVAVVEDIRDDSTLGG